MEISPKFYIRLVFEFHFTTVSTHGICIEKLINVSFYSQHVSSFILGSTSDFNLPMTLKDFDRKWTTTPKKAQPDLGTSIPVSISKIYF